MQPFAAKQQDASSLRARFRGMRFSDYFIDIGVPDDYYRAQREFAQLFPADTTLFLDRDGVLNRHLPGDYVRRWDMWEWMPGALEACPEGWRVPTDADWQNLECCLGMSPDEAAKMDWRGNIAHRMFSLEDDPCDLNLRLGGYWTTNINMGRSPYRMMGLFGYYWSSSLDEQKEGMYYLYRKFAYNRNEVCRQSIESEKVKLYVRYVRDVH